LYPGLCVQLAKIVITVFKISQMGVENLMCFVIVSYQIAELGKESKKEYLWQLSLEFFSEIGII